MIPIRQWLFRPSHRATDITNLLCAWQIRHVSATAQQAGNRKYPPRPKVDEDEFEEVFLKGRLVFRFPLYFSSNYLFRNHFCAIVVMRT